MIRPGSIYFVWGPSGGFYWRYALTPRGRYWRLCLWWVAIVWLPLDLDELVSGGLDFLNLKVQPGEIQWLRRTRSAAWRLWRVWLAEGWDKPHYELAEALEFAKEEVQWAPTCYHMDHDPPDAAKALAAWGLGVHKHTCPCCKSEITFTITHGGVTYS